jgi:hypothetical protein
MPNTGSNVYERCRRKKENHEIVKRGGGCLLKDFESSFPVKKKSPLLPSCLPLSPARIASLKLTDFKPHLHFPNKSHLSPNLSPIEYS